jgi:hypothetical protein
MQEGHGRGQDPHRVVAPVKRRRRRRGEDPTYCFSLIHHRTFPTAIMLVYLLACPPLFRLQQQIPMLVAQLEVWFL